MTPVRILHCHSTFSLGGKEARAVRLMNAFDDAAQHAVLSAMPDRLAARDAIARGIKVDFPADAPPLTGAPTPLRLWRLASYMRGFDLVLTYNWGAFDAVMARRLFDGPPLVHHEDGFNEDEAARLNPKRNRYRRLGLKAAHRLVVPSERLEKIARRHWGQEALRIPNGVPVASFARPPEPDEIPGFERQGDEVVIGTAAALDSLADQPGLRRAIGEANRELARERYDEREMIAAYARLYGRAIGRPDAFADAFTTVV